MIHHEVLEKEIRQCFQQQKYEEIILLYEKNPAGIAGQYALLLKIAAAYLETGDARRAIQLTKQIIIEEKKFFVAYIFLARAYYFALTYPYAIEVLQEMLQMYEREIANDLKKSAYNLLGTLWRAQGCVEKSKQAFLEASRLANSIEEKALEYSNYLLMLNYQAEDDTTSIIQEHKQYNTLFKTITPYSHVIKAKQKLRIGYISPDLRHHIVTFFSYHFFAHFDSNNFEVICYANCTEDITSAQIKPLVSRWYNIKGMAAQAVARQIYEDEIDILVDLSGHTANNCLPVLAYKPAPIQICGIGYFNTTGLDTVDYFITDQYVDPADRNDTCFTEKLIRMSSTHLCYTARSDAPECKLPACLSNQYITFGTFNSIAKITDEILTLWGKILKRVKNSRLILKDKIFGDQDGCERFYARIYPFGLSKEQVELRPFTLDYMLQYLDIDIALDTYPYPGGGTTCEALYMGIPVITLVGIRHGARFGYSILKNVGLEECIAFNHEEYVTKAVQLAKDKERLVYLHGSLRERMLHSPLMDGRTYLAEIEQIYRAIWQQRMQGELCADFSETLIVEPKNSLTQSSEQLQQKLKQTGNLYMKEAQYDKVLECVIQLIELDENDIDAFYMGAAAYLKLGDTVNAVILAKKVIAFKEDHIGAYMILAFCYNDQMLFEENIDVLKKIIILSKASMLKNQYDFLGQAWCLLGSTYGSLGDIESAKYSYLELSKVLLHPVDQSAAFSSYLMSLHYNAALDQRQMLVEHKKYNAYFQSVKMHEHHTKKPMNKINIGYISPDFRQHAVVYFCYAFLEQYDKSQFNIYCYARGKADKTTEQLKSFGVHWREIQALSESAAAQLIYDDQIDILVDLSGHTANNCLPILAYKPAPIQVCGIGYFDTTGLSTIDYFLTDEYVDPKGKNDEFFSEKLVRLPHSHWCYKPRSDAPFCQDASVMRRGKVTFCCFNNFAKITDDMLTIWLEILNQIPGSKLVLKSKVLGSKYGLQLAQKRAVRAGFSTNQIEFRKSTTTHMKEYLEMDIALDTFPYPGGVTTCEALYMGVPVITLSGERHGSRFGYSILKNIGLEEGIAFSRDEYIEKAINLAKDRELLNHLHKQLRSRMQNSSVMDDKRYMMELEGVYLDMYNKFAEKNKLKTAVKDIFPLLKSMVQDK